MVRQEIASMHFFRSEEAIDLQCCNFIFDTAASVLESIQELEEKYKLSRFCPSTHLISVVCGVSCILRILRSPYATYVDQERGSRAVLQCSAVHEIRFSPSRRAIRPTKEPLFAQQVWSSERRYSKGEPDGRCQYSLYVCGIDLWVVFFTILFFGGTMSF